MSFLSTLAFGLSLAAFANAQGQNIVGKTPYVSNNGLGSGQINGGSSNIGPASHADGIVPKSERDRFGNQNNNIPLSWTPTRYQQVFDGSDLPAALPIAFIGFRQDEGFTSRTGHTIDVEIKLGFTKKTSSTITSNYANNYDSGKPVVVLKRQMIKLDNLPSTKPTDPHKFFLEFKLDSKFIWVRIPGRNLLIEITVFGNSNQNRFFTYPLDAASATTSTRLWSSSPTASTGILGQGFALAMQFLQTSRKGIKSSSFTTFGNACLGTRAGSCPSLNPNGGTLASRQNANIFAIKIDAEAAMLVTGFELFTRSITTATLTVQTQVFLADSAGRPTGNPVRTGTMKLGTAAAFYKTTFTPLAIKAKQRFFISYTSIANQMYFPWVASGDFGTYYWHSPTSTTWNGPFATSIRFSFKVNCSGVGPVAPVHFASLPELGHTSTLDLANAKKNSSSLLILGATRLNLNLAILGAPQCSLLSSLDLLLVVPTGSNGAVSFPLAIPLDTKLLGARFFTQFAVLDIGANKFGFAFTNGGDSTIGG